MNKKLFIFFPFLMGVLLLSSCSSDDSHDVMRHNTYADSSLQSSLEDLNNRIKGLLAESHTRANDDNSNTKTVALADAVGALKGAYQGRRFGFWGAVTVAVVRGAIESYKASYMVFSGTDAVEVHPEIFLGANYVDICDKAMCANDSLYKWYLNIKNPVGDIDVDLLVGIIHNAVLDSIFNYENQTDKLRNYNLKFVDNNYKESLRLGYGMENVWTDNRNEGNMHDVMGSFSQIFLEMANSEYNTNIIVDEYIDYVDDHRDVISTEDADALIQTLSVARNSYNYWNTKY